MSRRDLPDAEPALDELLDAASEPPDDEEAPPRPAFEAVLARANRIDPAAMPAEPPADVVRDSSAADAELDAWMGTLVRAAAEEAEADMAVASRPAAPWTTASKARERKAVVMVVSGLAAAAALVFAVQRLDPGSLLERDAERTGSQAAAQVDDEHDLLTARETGPEESAPAQSERQRRGRAGGGADRDAGSGLDVAPLEPNDAGTPVEVSPGDALPADALELGMDAPAEETEQVEDAAPARRKQRRAAPTLDELDARAQQQLGEGDREAARATLENIVRKAGKSSMAQLAYGDLFTLAHARGDTKEQKALWKAYLRKFPSGRFADDARAGLCRHASEDAVDGCWADYLADFPKGAYRGQAHRALGSGGGSSAKAPMIPRSDQEVR